MDRFFAPDVLGLVILAAGNVILFVRWSYALNGTRDKPPEWEPAGRAAWPFHPQRDGYRRFLVVCIAIYALIAVAALAMAIVRAQEPPFSRPFPNWVASYPVGSCVVANGPMVGDTVSEPMMGPSDLRAVACSEAHTHVVSAWVGADRPCPPVAVEWGLIGDDKLCLRADN